MKVQEVLLRAMAKKISWWQAAETIGVSARTMRRWRERLEAQGYDGLADRRKGVMSPKRVSFAMCEQVLGLYRERYYDLNIRHFHEKLREEHGIELSYTWVQKALQGAGLVAKRSKRGTHRRRRARRSMPGMLLPIEGSKHCWFQNSQRYDLIVILDDATSEIYYAQLVEEESTRTVTAGLREVIERKGLFCALYSDRGSHFFVKPKAGEPVDKHRLTQVGRAMKESGVPMIPAYSPQARGCSERNFGTWQGRLPQELRLAGISTVEAANRFLSEHYIDVLNRKFAVAPEQKASAFRRSSRSDLDWVFTVQTESIVAKDNTLAIGDRVWQIEKSRFRGTLAGCTVTIHQHLDGRVSLRFGPHVVGRFDSHGRPLTRANQPERGGKAGSMETGENQKQVSTASHTSLGISPTTARFPLSHRAADSGSREQTKKQGGSRRLKRKLKADRSRANQSGHLDVLTTVRRPDLDRGTQLRLARPASPHEQGLRIDGPNFRNHDRPRYDSSHAQSPHLS